MSSTDLEISNLESLKPLTHKQRRFVLAYVFETQGNQTKAAERAKYTGDEKYLAMVGSRLIRNDKVSNAIRQLMARVCMPNTEALAILARIARGTFAPFLNETEDGRVVLDLSTPKAKENIHLIKKVKQKQRTTETKDGNITELETEVEIHDAKDAAKKIADLASGGDDTKQLKDVNVNVVVVQGNEEQDRQPELIEVNAIDSDDQ